MEAALIASAVVAGVAVVALILSFFAARFAVHGPRSPARRYAWQVVCGVASLLPVGLLALAIVALASVEPAKGWLDEAGHELLKAIVLTVAGGAVLGLLGFSMRVNRSLLSATLKRALPNDTKTREDFNVRDKQIRDGKGRDCRNAIAGFFDRLASLDTM